MRVNRNTLLSIAGALACGLGGLHAQNSVPFQCQDLPDAGLILVSPSSPDYGRLLKDIQDHIAVLPDALRRGQLAGNSKSVEALPISAILLNKSEKPVVTIEVEWRYEYTNGRTLSLPQALLVRDSLMPGAPDSRQKEHTYWNVILPGSKRYITEAGMAGANTDVRPPKSDEAWTGPIAPSATSGGAQGSGKRTKETVKSVTLILDGVFFEDGEFVGPDRDGLWESVASEANMRQGIARIARNGRTARRRLSDIFDEIADLTGPPSDNPALDAGMAGRGGIAGSESSGIRGGSIRPPLGPEASTAQIENRKTAILLAVSIEKQRRSMGDQRLVDLLAAQADSPEVHFLRR